ncbi:MAG: ABC transporter transmembrane domain-containing protein [Acidimicrobiia bacterium]|nr:ABC transporter transmembrane domain-containing protein [Acidimicrobiia bacterium]
MLSTSRRILQFWKPHRALGLGLVVTMMLRAVFTVVLAMAIKFVIDQVIEPDPDTSAWTIAGFLLIGFAVSLVAGLVAARLTARATADIIADVRLAVFSHLQRLPMSFYDRAATGDLMAHFSSDIAQLSRGVIRTPLIGLRAITAMALYIPVMFILEPRLALIAVIGIPLVIWLVYRFAPKSADSLDAEKQHIADVLGEVSSNLRAQRIIRAYALNGQSRRRFMDRIAALRDSSEKAERRIALEMVIAEYAVEFTKLAIIVAGAVLAFSGDLDPGSFAAFAAILTEFAYQASVLGMDVFPSVKQSEAGIRRIDALLAEEVAPDHTGTKPAPAMSGPIRLHEVVFRYREDQEPQLDRVSIDLPGESYIAIVGSNGAGKSSLLNVILNLYGLESGSVTVAGVDLAQVDLDDMRRRIGIAFQDTVLFEASLHENLTLGGNGFSPDDLDRAVSEAGLGHIVERLPGGIEADLGPGGVTLSAGEAQRVGIARALLRNPELLLLDEVASGLDPSSESELMGQIEHLREGRSIVSVTHRLESVKTADLIVVIDDGVVVETGTFEALLAAEGLFAGMWTKQHGFDVSANGLSARVHADRLKGIPVFADLDDDVLSDLAAVFESQYVDAGEVVFKEGEQGDSFYVIARGAVEVVRGLGTHDEESVAWLEDGDFFGEMALLSSNRRNASIRARGATTLLRLDRRSFSQLMATVPEARIVVEDAAAARAAENEAVLDR